MTTQTPNKPHRRGTLFKPANDQRLPLDTPRLPKPIAAANRAVHEAEAQFDGATARARELEDHAKRATYDMSAQKAAADARAVATDAEEALKSRLLDLYDAVADNLDAYRESRRQVAEEATAPLRELIGKAIEALDASREAVAIHHDAERWHNNVRSAALCSRQGAASMQRQFERRLAEHRRQFALRPNTPVDNDVTSLLAALALKFEEEIEAG